MRKNITVSVDQSVYRQAREWAARRDTSVSAVVQYLLERLPGLPTARGFHAPRPKPNPQSPPQAAASQSVDPQPAGPQPAGPPETDPPLPV